MTEAIALLKSFLATLPADSHERPGVIRSIEVLESYGNEPS